MKRVVTSTLLLSMILLLTPTSFAQAPSWRYEEPTGYKQAIVRIYSKDVRGRTRGIGSGTIVKWGVNKIVVLTARHVIDGAKSLVIETFKKKFYNTTVLNPGDIWDCAVLQIDGVPEGVTPAEVELGQAAMQKPGNLLTSLGYGGLVRSLAANTGAFVTYRRIKEQPNSPDDWMQISGHARQGDSGGGVFNQNGRLVGVLWGYDPDDKSIMCVQAGRIHIALDAAMRKIR